MRFPERWWLFRTVSILAVIACAAAFGWKWHETDQMIYTLRQEVSIAKKFTAHYRKEVNGQAAETQVAHASAAAFQDILKGGLDNLNSAYNALGIATVRISADKNTCHGVLVHFRGEVFIVTAAHCVVDNQGKSGGEVWFSKYLQEVVTGEDRDCERKNCYEGYGFIPSLGVDGEFSPEQVAADPRRDVAVIRGLKDFRLATIRHRALAIAEKSPTPLHLAYGVHWQSYGWGYDDADSRGSELLVPNLGIVSECAKDSAGKGIQRHFCEYALAVYAGDSGSGIVDEFGALIGIVNRGFSDKAKSVRTDACGPRSLRAFLGRQQWDD